MLMNHKTVQSGVEMRLDGPDASPRDIIQRLFVLSSVMASWPWEKLIKLHHLPGDYSEMLYPFLGEKFVSPWQALLIL